MMKPVIGIVTAKRFFPNNSLDEYQYVSSHYCSGIVRAGGIPVLVPLLSSEDTVYRALLQGLDGVLLSGGEDPAPHLYGEQPLPGLGDVDYERDLAEIAIIREACSLKLPVFGICRGVQILNVALGGTLVQDIPSQMRGALQHAQKGSRQYGSHRITLSPGILADALGRSETLVNSSHHQSVKDVAPGLRATAVADDGVIEGLESEDGCLIGVQWHPERMWSHDETMLNLARSFVRQAADYRQRRQHSAKS